MSNKFFAFIVGIPLILFVIIGGYFFWDINRPIQPPDTTNIPDVNVGNIPPPENIKNSAPKNPPPWTDPASETIPNTEPEQMPASQPVPKNPPTQNTTTQIKSPPLQNQIPPSGPKLAIHTQTEDVYVKDFYKNPNTQLLDNKGDAGLKDDPDYAIVYYVNGQSFNIALSGDSLQAARDAAEQSFLQILGISKTDACKLDVSLGVPATVNQSIAGIEYHLSFCPNGKPLP